MQLQETIPLRNSQESSEITVTWSTITLKIITEPNFIIFQLISVIPALRLPNRIVSGITWAR